MNQFEVLLFIYLLIVCLFQSVKAQALFIAIALKLSSKYLINDRMTRGWENDYILLHLGTLYLHFLQFIISICISGFACKSFCNNDSKAACAAQNQVNVLVIM